MPTFVRKKVLVIDLATHAVMASEKCANFLTFSSPVLISTTKCNKAIMKDCLRVIYKLELGLLVINNL
jgi:hypothetical protein